MDEIARLDAVGQAELIRRGELSPTELVDSTIARIESLNPAVNAVIHESFDAARAAAASPDLPDGPFRGVPMLLKDLWPASAGDPFHQGVKGLREVGYRHPTDSNITARYREAGFVLCGRTNTPELGLSATTEPLAYGPTRNPWNTDHAPGGSSGGAAAAVAAGMISAANASDGGGSIRIPAAHCGLVGLKPSRGRISMGPLQDEWGNSVQHVVSHTVRDSAAILDATAGPGVGDGVVAPAPPAPFAELADRAPSALRVGLMTASPRADTQIDPEVGAAVEAAAVSLEGLGHHVERSHPAALVDEAATERFGVLSRAGIAATLEGLAARLGRPVTEDDVEPGTWITAASAEGITGTEVMAAQADQHVYRRDMASWWADGFDILLTPTCGLPPPVVGDLVPSAENPIWSLWGSIPYSMYTSPFNVTGQPAISLPLGRTAGGLPIGVQFVGAYGREDLLLALARQLEQAIGWPDRAPMHP